MPPLNPVLAAAVVAPYRIIQYIKNAPKPTLQAHRREREGRKEGSARSKNHEAGGQIGSRRHNPEKFLRDKVLILSGRTHRPLTPIISLLDPAAAYSKRRATGPCRCSNKRLVNFCTVNPSDSSQPPIASGLFFCALVSRKECQLQNTEAKQRATGSKSEKHRKGFEGWLARKCNKAGCTFTSVQQKPQAHGLVEGNRG